MAASPEFLPEKFPSTQTRFDLDPELGKRSSPLIVCPRDNLFKRKSEYPRRLGTLACAPAVQRSRTE